MRSACTLIVNGKPIEARRGMTLVDAALRGGIVIPTDCGSGQCETCRVTVVRGSVASAEPEGCSVLACQAKISGPAEIHVEETPVPSRRRARVSSIAPLAPDIVEVRLDLDDPFIWRPGQYVKVAFKGYPSRDYSPTSPVHASPHPLQLIIHVKVYQKGAVSSALRGPIKPGHRVIVEGPFGTAFYRPGPTRLVLVGTGTGWAPLWAIARAARLQAPDRAMKVVVGARRLQSLYMRDALGWLQASGVTDTVLSCSRLGSDSAPDVRAGRTTDFLGTLTPDDTIFAAGAEGMVEHVAQLAAAAGAQCYADPFTLSTTRQTFFGRLRQALETSDPSRLRPITVGDRQHVYTAPVLERLPDETQPQRPRRPAGGFARWLKVAEP